jgi:hypothetical protein
MKKTIILFLIIFSRLLYSIEIWGEHNTGYNININCVTQSCIGCVWVCANSGIVLKTVNQGNNWINVSSNIPPSLNIVSITGAYLGKALIGGFTGSNTYAWLTRNDGLNWIQVFSQVNGDIKSVYMKDTTTGIIIGNPVNNRWSIWRTSNGGYSWDSSGLYLYAPTGETAWENSFCCVYPDVWFGTNNYKIYYSSNFGNKWLTRATNPEQNIYTIKMSYPYPPYSNFGFAGGANLMKTTNRGVNWFVINSPGSGNINGIALCDVQTWNWITRTGSNTIYATSNGGTNWYSAFNSSSGNYTYIHTLGATDVDFWASKSNGGLTHHWVFENVKNINDEIPLYYQLYQNYPNPFNPKTIIKYQIPKTQIKNQKVKLVLYNSLGQLIYILVDKQQSAGTYEVEFDGTNYPSGVYFYTLKTHEVSGSSTESFKETKRMVLVK